MNAALDMNGVKDNETGDQYNISKTKDLQSYSTLYVESRMMLDPSFRLLTPVLRAITGAFLPPLSGWQCICINQKEMLGTVGPFVGHLQLMLYSDGQ